jgi:hypothetical protein
LSSPVAFRELQGQQEASSESLTVQQYSGILKKLLKGHARLLFLVFVEICEGI